ncbi:MAG: enoyl-CoA hydratase, partial [Actinomycetota bacterium]|nr:enoyl-CoA hydratase [Actinomycetota bacterium]
MLVLVERSANIATLTLNRPDARNALSTELCDAILDGLATIEADREVRVVVVRGAGKTFCAGADLAAVSGPHAADFLVSFERMLEGVARFRLPTIAVIHGAALGGGFQLATVCDFRLAASDAVIGIPSSTLGILVNLENVQRLVGLGGAAIKTSLAVAAPHRPTRRWTFSRLTRIPRVDDGIPMVASAVA